MFLVDSNVFLEALLDQEKTTSVRSFLESVNLDHLFITDLSLYSIGFILFRLRKFELFNSFLEDMVFGGMRVLVLTPDQMIALSGKEKIPRRLCRRVDPCEIKFSIVQVSKADFFHVKSRKPLFETIAQQACEASI